MKNKLLLLLLLISISFGSCDAFNDLFNEDDTPVLTGYILSEYGIYGYRCARLEFPLIGESAVHTSSIIVHRAAGEHTVIPDDAFIHTYDPVLPCANGDGGYVVQGISLTGIQTFWITYVTTKVEGNEFSYSNETEPSNLLVLDYDATPFE